MTKSVASQIPGAKIDWISMADQTPPAGEWVLTYCSELGWPRVQSNMLGHGDINSGRDPNLLYWSDASDFDEVTHWAWMVELPKPRGLEATDKILEG